jgi:transposase-like protein
MKKKSENQYIKRNQRDYSYAFKLAIFREVKSGETGIKAEQLKYDLQKLTIF